LLQKPAVPPSEPLTARWDPVVLRLTEILGDLALLSAASTGERAVTAQIDEAASHVARAAALALPLSKYGSEGSPTP
jgi:hypothetical protein